MVSMATQLEIYQFLPYGTIEYRITLLAKPQVPAMLVRLKFY